MPAVHKAKILRSERKGRKESLPCFSAAAVCGGEKTAEIIKETPGEGPISCPQRTDRFPKKCRPSGKKYVKFGRLHKAARLLFDDLDGEVWIDLPAAP